MLRAIVNRCGLFSSIAKKSALGKWRISRGIFLLKITASDEKLDRGRRIASCEDSDMGHGYHTLLYISLKKYRISDSLHSESGSFVHTSLQETGTESSKVPDQSIECNQGFGKGM
jgi:hypothetical protein